MATVKLFAAEKDVNKAGHVKIYIQLLHDREKKFIPLEVGVIKAEHFDFEKVACKKGHPNHTVPNQAMRLKLSIAETCLGQLANRSFLPDELRDYIEQELNRGGGPITLQQAADKLISEFKQLKQMGSARQLAEVVRRFNEWNGGDKSLISINWERIHQWVIHFKAQGKAPTSYFTGLKSIFDRAIATDDFPADKHPYNKKGLIPKRSGIRKERTETIETVTKLAAGVKDLSGNMQLAADFVLAQFYCQGVSAVDLAMARKAHIITVKTSFGEKRYLQFHRYKNRNKDTSPRVSVLVTPELQEIFDRYPGDLLFPILTGFPLLPNGQLDVEDEFTAIDQKSEEPTEITKTWELVRKQRINKVYHWVAGQLKKDKYGKQKFYPGLNQMFDMKLSLVSMRFLWQNIARNTLGIDSDVVKAAVGHTNKDMTVVYSGVMQDRVDAANRKIMNLALKETKIFQIEPATKTA